MIQQKEIKKWQIDAEVTQEMIANDIGCTPQYVSMVFRGKKKNKKIVDAFVRRGCPRKFWE